MIDPQCQWISHSLNRRCLNLAEQTIRGVAVCHWHMQAAIQQLDLLSTDPAQRVRDHVEQLVGKPEVETGGRRSDKTAAMIQHLRDQLREEAESDRIPAMVGFVTMGHGLLQQMCAIIDAQEERIAALEQQLAQLDRATAHTRVIG